MLHETVCVLEFLDRQDVELVFVNLVNSNLYLLNHGAIDHIRRRDLRALIVELHGLVENLSATHDSWLAVSRTLLVVLIDDEELRYFIRRRRLHRAALLPITKEEDELR